jgi:hypothetical protein
MHQFNPVNPEEHGLIHHQKAPPTINLAEYATPPPTDSPAKSKQLMLAQGVVGMNRAAIERADTELEIREAEARKQRPGSNDIEYSRKLVAALAIVFGSASVALLGFLARVGIVSEQKAKAAEASLAKSKSNYAKASKPRLEPLPTQSKPTVRIPKDAVSHIPLPLFGR